jgi:cell division protein FtsI/penicillin-binding protein 2
MDTDKAPQTDQSRLTILGLCLTFGLAVIIAQLVRYQVFMHAELKQRAHEQRERVREVRLDRGYITDINGHFLAMNVYQWEIGVSPNVVANPEELASDIAILLDLDRDEVAAQLKTDASWLLLARHVPQEVGEALAGLEANGLVCTPSPQRRYPMAALAAHVIGIVNNTGNGFYGVEGYYNSPLIGITGTVLIEIGPMGEDLPLPPKYLRRPEPGTNLVLTLDLYIQHIALQELQWALDRFRAESGTVIVMDPRTGALLAVVSLPTYDPNHFATADSGLLQDPSVSSMWEPGSIFKIITWGAGLDSGAITPDTTVFDEGKVEVGGRVIENSDRKAHGEVTMTEALAHSLNTVAAYISTTMGKDQFYNYVRRFGFGNLTGVDLASEGPGMIKLPGDSDWFPSELGTNSFGQGIAVTPMQMITAAAAVANQGLLMRPHIVHQFITQDERGAGIKVIQVEPVMERQAISKEAAATLTDMLVEVVEHTATEAQVPGYRIAGKTGTAQIPTPLGYHSKDTIVSFVGYAPADDPEFIILVKLDKPKTSRWAAYTAAPAFRAIAERLLAYKQVPPDSIRLAQHGREPWQ